MPLGKVLGEFSANITSLTQTELSGGHIKIELNTVGEGTGEVPGRTMATQVARSHAGQAQSLSRDRRGGARLGSAHAL